MTKDSFDDIFGKHFAPVSAGPIPGSREHFIHHVNIIRQLVNDENAAYQQRYNHPDIKKFDEQRKEHWQKHIEPHYGQHPNFKYAHYDIARHYIPVDEIWNKWFKMI